MSSKIKVDTIENVAGSGNVSLGAGHNLVVPGTVSVTGETTLASHLNMGDNDKIKLGASDDLEIYHDASDSIIAEVGTGNLQIRADDFYLMKQDGSETMIRADTDSFVRLYYDNALKLATTANGIQVGSNTGVSSSGIISVINAGNSLEWGHSNAAGYRSTLGALSGGGQPFIAWSAEHGTDANTYRTRGLKGAVIQADNIGGLSFRSITNANADNQSAVTNMTIENAGAITMSPAGTELARFTGSQFMVGKTVGNFTTAGSIQQDATADGSPSYFYQVKTYSGLRNAWLNYHNGTYVGGINMTNTATSFPTSSDERLKKNIKDAPSGGDKIDAMKVRSFNWKVDDSLQEYGLIAQELEPVYAWPVETLDNGDAYTIDYTKLVPIMLKEIQDLRKRVATLESS